MLIAIRQPELLFLGGGYAEVGPSAAVVGTSVRRTRATSQAREEGTASPP